MKILIATNNKSKEKELSEILKSLGVKTTSFLKEGINSNPEENGETFEENSLIKALSAAKASGMWAVADDSGLMVDALSGQPGVHSARFGGNGISDAKRNALLLGMMEDVPEENRKASFISAITLAAPDGNYFTVKGECIGKITRAPFGGGGFGYDPIFYVPYYGKTFAELTEKEKNKISHRGQALSKFHKNFKIFIDKQRSENMGENQLTGKQRAKLRRMANGIQSLHQIGKEGISQTVIQQTDEALKARELVKLSVLETSPVSARQAAEILTNTLNAEAVQVIGRKLTLYRQSDKKKIVLAD